MSRANLKEIEAIVASYVDASKQAAGWTSSSNNIAGLVDKIAKTITIEGLFNDKLPQLDGEELPLGKTVEEYYQDLCAVTDYDDYAADATNAANDALKPYYPSYRPASYNYTIGRKKIPTTLKYDEYERASGSPDAFAAIVSGVTRRLYDTYGMFKYDIKKQILANLIAKIEYASDPTNATLYVQNTSTGAVDSLWKNATGDVAVCVKPFATAVNKSFAEMIAAGYLVQYDMIVDTSGAPTDTTTGEAFVEQIKKDVEAASFASEGHSLNGNSVGAETGLLLIIKKGVKPVLDVQVLAGAFNPNDLALPAEIVTVDNFGNDASGVYAILMDRRTCRLHPTYMAVREQLNGSGDFVNYFLHNENTAFISKNTFTKIYK